MTYESLRADYTKELDQTEPARSFSEWLSARLIAERERCARIAEQRFPGDSLSDYCNGQNEAGAEIAAKIRSGECD